MRTCGYGLCHRAARMHTHTYIHILMKIYTNPPGGGMRGCVPAGMVCAIEQLGLRDAFDAVYGSSAGIYVHIYVCMCSMCSMCSIFVGLCMYVCFMRL